MATPSNGNLRVLFSSKMFRSILLLISLLQACQSLDQPVGDCTTNDIFVEGDALCTREYYRCESNSWLKALCVCGYFNSTVKECVPPSESTYCRDIGIDERDFPTVRQKREVVKETKNECSRSYLCPVEVVQEIVYPDWTNKECDTFYQCLQGVLTVRSCKVDEFRYYNPRTLSCEHGASVTNTCLKRETTDLSPIGAL